MSTENEERDKRLRTWLSFIAGMGWLAKFAILSPAALSPQFTILIAALLFGPSIFGFFSGGKE